IGAERPAEDQHGLLRHRHLARPTRAFLGRQGVAAQIFPAVAAHGVQRGGERKGEAVLGGLDAARLLPPAGGGNGLVFVARHGASGFRVLLTDWRRVGKPGVRAPASSPPVRSPPPGWPCRRWPSSPARRTSRRASGWRAPSRPAP